MTKHNLKLPFRQRKNTDLVILIDSMTFGGAEHPDFSHVEEHAV